MTIDKAALAEVASLREEISEIDQQLMLLLGLRFRCTDQVSEFEIKSGAERPAVDAASLIQRVKDLAIDAGVPPELGVTLMHAVVAAVNENHERIKASKSH
jgi:chorismate mutase